MENKNNSNVKWYDLLLIGILIFIIMVQFLPYFGGLNSFLIISIGLSVTCIIFFTFGMVYHKFKNKKYIWLAIDFVLFFLTLLLVSPYLSLLLVTTSCTVFYFTFMRKEFKKEKK